jgi:hypothetical protein
MAAMAGAAMGRGAAAEPAAEPAPVLGMNLAPISDWSTEHPFLDLMKSSRPWLGHLPGRWGGVEPEALLAAGHVDAGGHLLSIPPEVEHVGTLILTDQPEAAVSLAGRYVLRHEGRGEISVGGRAQEVSRAPGEIRFDYTPGHGAVEIEIAAIDAQDPLRDISVVREDRLSHAAAGALFNPDWLARVSRLRLLRVMDWMGTNGSKAQHWQDRPRPADQRWTEAVPAEVLARLANEIGADLWVTLPHLADDAYVRGFARLMYEALDPRLRIHAEWSNEVWNFGFRQAKWAEEQAAARWGEAAPGDAWMQVAGRRAAQVADIWAEVFGAQAEARLVRVIGVQTGWRGLEAAALEAPLAVAEGARPPAQSFDAYAVTGYVGHDVARDDDLPGLRRALARGTAAERVLEMLRADAADLTGRFWPHHARVAARHGLRLVMYEAGPHMAAGAAGREDDAITDFLAEISHAPEVAALVEALFESWTALGGTQVTAYHDIGWPSRWGSWGALRHIDDDTPRWQSLMRYNRSGADWESRAPGSFEDGVTLRGGAAAERLVGTPEEDLLLAGGGNDIVLAGPGDRVDGGAGYDRLVLPEALRGAPVAWQGARLAIGQGRGRILVAGIEEIAYGTDMQAQPVPERPR